MQLAEKFEPVPELHNRQNIEKFVGQSLLGDWIIRVQYSTTNAKGQASWQQWGDTLFAIRSPVDVMQTLDDCRANFPEQELRIYAEKVRPESRIVYGI